MADMCAHCNSNCLGNRFARRSLAQKFDVLRPGQRHQHTHSCGGAMIKNPARWRVINPHNIQTNLAHERKIDIDLLGSSEIVSVRVRLEWSVSDTFDKKLSVTFEKEFRDRANSRVCAHSGNSLVQATHRRKGFKVAAVHRTTLIYAWQLRVNHLALKDQSSRSASRMTSAVRSMSSNVCAVEINPVSNCDGAK